MLIYSVSKFHFTMANMQRVRQCAVCMHLGCSIAKPFPELMQLFSVCMHVLCIVQRTITLLHQLSVVPRPNSGQSLVSSFHSTSISCFSICPSLFRLLDWTTGLTFLPLKIILTSLACSVVYCLETQPYTMQMQVS